MRLLINKIDSLTIYDDRIVIVSPCAQVPEGAVTIIIPKAALGHKENAIEDLLKCLTNIKR